MGILIGSCLFASTSPTRDDVQSAGDCESQVRGAGQVDDIELSIISKCSNPFEDEDDNNPAEIEHSVSIDMCSRLSCSSSSSSSSDEFFPCTDVVEVGHKAAAVALAPEVADDDSSAKKITCPIQ